jgi:hypothetical protein
MYTPRHPRARTGCIGGAPAVCAMVITLWPASALGSTLSISGPTLSYSGAEGEATADLETPATGQTRARGLQPFSDMRIAVRRGRRP